MAVDWKLNAAVEINGLWHEAVLQLPLGAAELIDEPSDDEIVAIIRRYAPEAGK